MCPAERGMLTSVYGMWYMTALLFASIAGLVGASIVFWFFVKVMVASERPMDPTEFRIVGAVGTLTRRSSMLLPMPRVRAVSPSYRSIPSLAQRHPSRRPTILKKFSRHSELRWDIHSQLGSSDCV